MVKEQIKSVVSDIGIDSVKTGMMYSEETIRGVVESFEELWTVEDHPPVSHGRLVVFACGAFLTACC